MKLQFIEIDKLYVDKANMRFAKRPPDVSDILPSVRARGVLVPLLVRPNGSPETFEIVAGRRRYFAARAVADGKFEPVTRDLESFCDLGRSLLILTSVCHRWSEPSLA